MICEGIQKYRQELKKKYNNIEMPKNPVSVALRKPMIVSTCIASQCLWAYEFHTHMCTDMLIHSTSCLHM